jgi:Rrf2 family protein
MVAVDLAIHANKAPVQARSIARRHGIPIRFLEQVLHAMKKAGLVESQRGAQGGYLLTHKPSAMSVADIFEALEGPVFHRTLLGQRTRDRHAAKPELLLGDIWDQVQQAERKVLENITIEQLAMRLREIDAQRTPMYHI